MSDEELDEDLQLALALSLSLKEAQLVSTQNSKNDIKINNEKSLNLSATENLLTKSPCYDKIPISQNKKLKIETQEFKDEKKVDEKSAKIKLAVESEFRWSKIQTGILKRQKPKLTNAQISSLKWARKYLFSVISGSNAILEENDCTKFNFDNLKSVLERCQIKLKNEEIFDMLSLFVPNCEHKNLNFRLCQKCWEDNFEHKKEKIRNEECDWNQFCWIFDQCELKAEKSGRVW